MSANRPRANRKTRIATTTAVLVLGGGAAFAFWSATGDGSGSATTGTATPFTVTTGAAAGAALTPGGPTQTVPFTVTNPGTGSQYLAAVKVTVAGAGGTEWLEYQGCSALDYTVGTPTFIPGQIAAGGKISGTVTVTMNNLGSNQDACKGLSVPLYFAAS